MSGEGRAPGFYPDPWGTPDERYFDGVAWARTTRGADGFAALPDPTSPAPTTAPPSAPSNAAVAATPMAASPISTAPAIPTSAPPPGWHPDPWAAAALRYWDGRQWTGHVSGMPGQLSGMPVAVAPRARLAEEHTAARWAKAGLSWAGPALGIGAISGAFQWSWIADHWDALTAPGGSTDASGNSGASILGQLAIVAVVVGAVLFLLWFYRSASVASSSGMRGRRTPGLAVASFFIPVVNLWWPYQSTLDLLPERHPARQVVRRWWLLWIGCMVGGVAIIATAFASVVALGIATGATVVLAVLAAITARVVVSEVTDAHAQLAGV